MKFKMERFQTGLTRILHLLPAYDAGGGGQVGGILVQQSGCMEVVRIEGDKEVSRGERAMKVSNVQFTAHCKQSIFRGCNSFRHQDAT